MSQCDASDSQIDAVFHLAVFHLVVSIQPGTRSAKSFKPRRTTRKRCSRFVIGRTLRAIERIRGAGKMESRAQDSLSSRGKSTEP